MATQGCQSAILPSPNKTPYKTQGATIKMVATIRFFEQSAASNHASPINKQAIMAKIRHAIH